MKKHPPKKKKNKKNYPRCNRAFEGPIDDTITKTNQIQNETLND